MILALPLSATLLVLPQSSASAESQCTTGTYATSDQAKANYGNDCGQPFENTTTFRCDWVPGGWECSGPGSANTSVSAPADTASLAAPVNLRFAYLPDANYLGALTWDEVAGAAKYNVYVDGEYAQTVDTNRLTVTRGSFTYEVVAIGSGEVYSSKSDPLITDGSPAQADLESIEAPVNLWAEVPQGLNLTTVILNWDAVSFADGYDVYVDGSYVKTALSNTSGIQVPPYEHDFSVVAFHRTSSGETRHSTTSQPLTVDAGTMGIATPPANESFPVIGTYEGSRALISWLDDPSSTSTYMVYRDGIQVATGLNLDTFQDPNPGGTSHSYQVVSRTAGRPVLQTTISLTSGEPTQIANAPQQIDDNNSGDSAAFVNSGGLADRLGTLNAIDDGQLEPDPDSRLGAYAATAGYPEGTVGYAAHEAIGAIYVAMGPVGEEEIGTVFNSPEAMALYDEPVNGPASLEMAEIEVGYWDSQPATSFGGFLGSLFRPVFRDHIQRFFGGDLATPPADEGGDGSTPSNPSDYADPFDQDGDGTLDWVDNDRDGDGVDNDEDHYPDDERLQTPMQRPPSDNEPSDYEDPIDREPSGAPGVTFDDNDYPDEHGP